MLALNKYRDLIDTTDGEYCISNCVEIELITVEVMEAINADLDTLEECDIPPLVIADYMIETKTPCLEQALEKYIGCNYDVAQWAFDQFGGVVPAFIRDYVDWFQVAKELVQTFKVWQTTQYGITYYFKVNEYE